MARDDRGPHILAMDAFLLAALLTAVLAGQSWLLIVALFLLAAIFWTQGALRFPRTRRFFSDLGQGVRDGVRNRKPSRQTVTRLSIVVGVVALLVILNRLRLSAPGEGRGLSLELSGLQLGFTGVNTTGDWLATIVTYAMVLAVLGTVWWRIWKPIDETASRMAIPYLVCVGVFLAMPVIFALLMWQVAPTDPKENAAFAETAYKTTLSVMAGAVAAAIALPYGPWTWSPTGTQATPDDSQETQPARQRDRLRVFGD